MAGIPQILYGSTWLLPFGQFVFYVGMTLFVLRRKKVEPLLKKTEKGVEQKYDKEICFSNQSRHL
ncbi:MAG: hypothetical protein ABS900_01810 [Candidatus Limivicinus sp.]